MRIEVTGAQGLKTVARQLRREADGKAMRKDLVSELRRSTKPAVVAVREAARALPARHPSVQQRDRRGRYASGFHSGHNLRRRMAQATSAQVRLSGKAPGVKVRLSKRSLRELAPPARMFDRVSWRHPVFGRREHWVDQHGVPGWFERANQSQFPAVRAGIKTALDRLEQRLSSH